MKKLALEEIQAIDKIRGEELEAFALALSDTGIDNQTLAAAFMLQGLQFLLFDGGGEQWMRDKYLALADELSRYRFNQIGFDVE